MNYDLYVTVNPICHRDTPIYSGNHDYFIYNIIGGPNVNFVSAVSHQNLATHLDIDFSAPFTETTIFSDLKMITYDESFKSSNVDKHYAIAKHNLINDKFLIELATKQTLDINCKLIATLYVDKARDALIKVCAKPRVGWQGLITCPLAGFLSTNIGDKAAKSTISGGCKYIVKNVSEKISEVTIEIFESTKDNINEFKAWISFINTVEGAFWIVGQVDDLQL